MDKKLVTIENEKKVEYDIIIEFTSNKNNKQYIAYTDNQKDEKGNLKIYIANYTKNNELYKLVPIESKEEIDMFNSILEEIKKELSKNN